MSTQHPHPHPHPQQDTASSSASSESQPFSHQPFTSSTRQSGSEDHPPPPFYSSYPSSSSSSPPPPFSSNYPSTSQQYDYDPPQTSSGRPTTSSGFRPGTANPFRQQAYADAYGFDAGRSPTTSGGGGGGMDWDPYANTRPRTSRSRGVGGPGTQYHSNPYGQQQQQGMGGVGGGHGYIDEEEEYGYVDEEGEEESEDEGLFAFLPPSTAEQEEERQREREREREQQAFQQQQIQHGGAFGEQQQQREGVGGSGEGREQPQTPEFAYSMGGRPPRVDHQESYVTARSAVSEQASVSPSQQGQEQGRYDEQEQRQQGRSYDPPLSPPSTESNSNNGSRGGAPREGEFRMMRLDGGVRRSQSRERERGRRSEEGDKEKAGEAKEDGEGAENRAKEEAGDDEKKKEEEGDKTTKEGEGGEGDDGEGDDPIPRHYQHFQPNPARSNANAGPYKRHREYHYNQAYPQYAFASGVDVNNNHSGTGSGGLPPPPGTGPGTGSGGKPSTRGSYGYAGDYADRERWERRRSKQRRGGTGTTTAGGASEGEGYGAGSEGYGRGGEGYGRRPGTGVSEVDGEEASVGSLRKGSWGYESREWDEEYEGESREGSIKMEFDFDAIEDEDSPYPEVRASVSNIDDPDMPAMTVRMWVVGLLLCMTSSAFNVFFNFRQPAPSIVPLVLLLLSYPVGKFMAFTLPITTYRIPLPCIPSRWLPSNLPRTVMRALRPMTFPHAIEFSLNPGPWNIKEHVLVYIMANVAVGNPYALNAIVVLEVYYEFKTGYWFSLVLVLATQLTGFGLAGMCRRFLVWPASMVWPQNLVACTLLNTLHAEDEDDGIGMLGGPYPDPAGAGGEAGMMPRKRGMSRYKFFIYCTIGSFFFFFLPGYLFEALSVFSFVCWAAPNNVKVNQLFGVKTGLGMSVLTFDWTQITWIGSPLMVPWWAEVHIFAGFVIFYWIMTPILYYTNAWQLAYFPISANQPFDRFGNSYNIARVLKADGTFDEEMYDRYSPLFLPATYAVTYLLAFCLSTCVIVHTVLYHGKTLLNGFKKMRVENDDIHAKLMRNYPEVPDWWYASAFCTFFALAIVAVEVWDTGVPVWALLLSVLLPVVYILPSGFIYAMTGQGINLNILAQIIPGSLLAGQPLANMVFKAYSVQTLSEATSFIQDLKLGHYVKVPPRATFLVQLVATTLAAFIQVGVKQWIFDNVEDICSDNQKSNLTCPHNQVFYTASAVWGLIGPTRQFGKGSIYHYHLYAIVIGVFLPIPFWLWRRRYPNSWVKWVSTPVVLTGVSWIPPATGINYSSWFMVGVVFQYVVRKRNFAWWSKFNYVLSSALDSGTVVAVIVIFFTLQFPKYRSGTDEYGVEVKWWGNMVHRQTADYMSKPLLTIPAEGIPIPNRS